MSELTEVEKSIAHCGKYIRALEAQIVRKRMILAVALERRRVLQEAVNTNESTD